MQFASDIHHIASHGPVGNRSRIPGMRPDRVETAKGLRAGRVVLIR